MQSAPALRELYEKEQRKRQRILERQRRTETAKGNRWGHRDALMILLAFRHGLRAGEVVDLRWEQIDFNGAALHVRRIKNGSPSTHPLTGRELRALRRHLRESQRSPFVFVSERGAPLNAAGFSRMIERAGKAAGWGSRPTPTCCGMRAATPANAGHDTRALQAYLGHRNIQNTVRYSELAPGRFARSGKINRKKPGYVGQMPGLLRLGDQDLSLEVRPKAPQAIENLPHVVGST